HSDRRPDRDGWDQEYEVIFVKAVGLMIEDLSKHHHPVGNLFPWPAGANEFARFRLTDEQFEFFKSNGYLAGVPMLNEGQVEVLRAELAQLASPSHPGKQLFYEYHFNESSDPARILFHALGAWRVAPGFHDLLWNPAFLVAASQLLSGAVRF